MKIRFFTTCLSTMFVWCSYAQTDTIPPAFEYATVFLKKYYQGNIVKNDAKGASKSPLLYMPDGNAYMLFDSTDPENPKEFLYVNNVLNYMAKFNWRFVSQSILPYEGDGGNRSKSMLVNTNEYMQLLYFERPVQK